MVSAIYTFPYARTAGMGLSFKHGATWPRFVVASIITVGICAVFLSWLGIILIAAVWCLSMPVLCLFRSRFGGLTGDNYGAINEISEVLTALLMIIIIQFLGQYMP
jgi:adenosylcobinamide-GDP ribazoletransferase